MWQKDDEDVQWHKKTDASKKGGSGPHPDYEANLLVAQNFIHRMEKSLLPGMNIGIKGSHGLERSLLVISWTPPRYAKVDNWANPIFLHQSKQSFAKSLEFVFNDYVRKVEMFEKRYGSMYAEDKQEEPAQI